MKISEVRIRKVENSDDSKLKAVASVTIDECFVVHDIKVIKGESGMFIAMPSKKTKEGEFKDVAHPINPATRQELSDAILNAFAQAV
ncbi:MAG: septation regulator SpoVG [Clostridia bacterium]|nr:septation regulator SpoVG [Clostridia bacterium]